MPTGQDIKQTLLTILSYGNQKDDIKAWNIVNVNL